MCIFPPPSTEPGSIGHTRQRHGRRTPTPCTRALSCDLNGSTPIRESYKFKGITNHWRKLMVRNDHDERYTHDNVSLQHWIPGPKANYILLCKVLYVGPIKAKPQEGGLTGNDVDMFWSSRFMTWHSAALPRRGYSGDEFLVSDTSFPLLRPHIRYMWPIQPPGVFARDRTLLLMWFHDCGSICSIPLAAEVLFLPRLSMPMLSIRMGWGVTRFLLIPVGRHVCWAQTLDRMWWDRPSSWQTWV